MAPRPKKNSATDDTFSKIILNVLWATKMGFIVPKLCHDMQTISFKCFDDI